MRPEVVTIDNVVVPLLDGEEKEPLTDSEYQEQLLDWLGMVMLHSPRVVQHDTIDPYLSQWTLPDRFVESMGTEVSASALQSSRLVHAHWWGLASTKFTMQLLLLVRSEVGQRWFAMSATAFGGHAYALLCRGRREAAVWESDRAA